MQARGRSDVLCSCYCCYTNVIQVMMAAVKAAIPWFQHQLLTFPGWVLLYTRQTP